MSGKTLITLLLAALAASVAIQAQDRNGEAEPENAAEEEILSPRASFEAFVEAVINENDRLRPAERNRLIAGYIDLDTRIAAMAESDEQEIEPEAARQIKRKFLGLVQSQRFADNLAGSGLRVTEEGEIDMEAGTAEITINLDDALGEARGFRVKMTLDRENRLWRWHTMEALDGGDNATPAPDSVEETDEQKFERLAQEVGEVRELIRKLTIREKQLLEELIRLTDAAAARATPEATTRAVFNATMAGDADKVLALHTEPRRKLKDEEDFRKRVAALSERIESFDIISSEIDRESATRATVRVELHLFAEGTLTEMRTINVSLGKVGDEWLVDEEP